MAFGDDVVRILSKPPSESAPEAPEAARTEAAARARRGDSSLVNDPLGEGPARALALYQEALELDPSCKHAYEGIARVVLKRASPDERPAIDTAIRALDVGQKRLPQEGSLKELSKKLRALIPAEPGIGDRDLTPVPSVTPSGRQIASKSWRGKGPGQGEQRICPYCKSPIPAGWAKCKSCSLSGEMPVPKLPERNASLKRPKQPMSPFPDPDAGPGPDPGPLREKNWIVSSTDRRSRSPGAGRRSGSLESGEERRMIERLTGSLLARGVTDLVLDVNGIGYKVEVSIPTSEALADRPLGARVTLLTHLHLVVNNDPAIRLFGFATEEERRLFRLLLPIKGVGPQTALRILSSARSSAELARTIASGDPKKIKAKGVGPKIAERVVVELRGKVDGLSAPGPSPGERPLPKEDEAAREAYAAFRGLEFEEDEARKLVATARRALGPDAGTEALIREGLRSTP
ncbi:hypothetical protein HY251_14675 [bacterium]|nr:hypothetical protein [bacterium]